jgi:hypothetical protein
MDQRERETQRHTHTRFSPPLKDCCSVAPTACRRFEHDHAFQAMSAARTLVHFTLRSPPIRVVDLDVFFR